MRSELRDVQLAGSISFGSGLSLPLTGGEIAALTIEEGADGALTPGAVLCASCTLDLVNDQGQWLPGGSMLGGQILTGATLMLRLGASDGEGNTLWRDLGVFQIESALCLESEARLRLSCADSIGSELQEPFVDELEYPVSLSRLWTELIGQTRYNWSGSVPNGAAVVDSRPDWQGASLRSAMGMIAAAAGCYVCIDRGGSLQLRPVRPVAEYALDPDCYLRLERGDGFYGPVDALRLSPVGEDAAERLYCADADQTALHVLSVADNPLFRQDAAHLDELARGMLAQVAGYYTENAEFSWRGDPELRIGDRVRLTDTHGRAFTGILSRQTLRFEGCFQAACGCSLPRQADSGLRRALTPEGGLNAAALTGAINGALLSVGSVTANKLSAGAVTAEKLAVGAVDAGAVSAVAARLKQLTADDIQTDELAAAFAAFAVITAGSARFDRATVAHLISEALNLRFGTAEDVFVENLRVSCAQMISASVGSLCIRAGDGSYYRLKVDGEGRVSAEPVSPAPEELATGQTGDGGMILETEITADKLNTANLLASYALLNEIDAARIDVDQLFARAAFITALNTADISSNTYIQQSIADGVTGEIGRYVRLDDDGLHVGKRGANGEVCIDDAAVSVALNGRQYSRFGANYVQFGRTQLRGASDGGMLFKTLQEV